MPEYIENMSLGRKIKIARVTKGWDQSELAFRVGVTTGFISHIEIGKKNPSIQVLNRIAAALELSIGELADEPHNQLIEEPAPISDSKVALEQIPVYNTVRAGQRALVFDSQPIEYIAIPKSENGTRFAMKVKGDSMRPKIESGDTVIISQKREVKRGDVCLVVFEDGESCIRHVQIHDEMVTLTSANPDYPPQTFKKNEVKWFYKVVGYYRTIKS